MRWTKEEYDAYQRRQSESKSARLADRYKDRGEVESPKPERIAGDGVSRPIPDAPGHRQRFFVVVRSFRSRLCDPDNLVGKYHIDCLRHAGLLPDDTPEFMDYRIEQQKCPKEEERTEITVTKID